MKSLTSILLATSLSLLTTSALPNDYCTFYADENCTQQVGSVAYDVYNTGCFQNDGGYISCYSASTVYEEGFARVQSPSNDDTCGCQSNCATFGYPGSPQPFSGCVPINLTPGYTDFRINQGRGCSGNNC